MKPRWLGSRKAPPFRPKSGAEPYQSYFGSLAEGSLSFRTENNSGREDLVPAAREERPRRSETLEVFENLRLVPQMELGKGSHGRRMGNPRRQSRPSYAAGDPDGTRGRRSAGRPPLSQPTVKFSSSAGPARPNAQKFL